jgi:hypothetical protein
MNVAAFEELTTEPVVAGVVHRSTAGAQSAYDCTADSYAEWGNSPVDGGGNCEHFRIPKVKQITSLPFPTNPSRNACTLMAAR